MPSVFQNNWAPQIMPQTSLALTNTFANPNLNAMGGGYMWADLIGKSFYNSYQIIRFMNHYKSIYYKGFEYDIT